MKPVYPYADPPSWVMHGQPRAKHGTYFIAGLLLGIAATLLLLLL